MKWVINDTEIFSTVVPTENHICLTKFTRYGIFGKRIKIILSQKKMDNKENVISKPTLSEDLSKDLISKYN